MCKVRAILAHFPIIKFRQHPLDISELKFSERRAAESQTSQETIYEF
jgi:hypothetical protein